MIYRDDEGAAEARVGALRAEVAALRRRPETAECERLRVALHGQSREITAARRGLERLRRRRWRALPRSLTELLVAGAVAYGLFVLGLVVQFVVVCISAIVS